MATARSLLCAAAAAWVLQTATCFSGPTRMALGDAGANRGAAVGRRDAISAFGLAVGCQVAALSLMQPSRSYDKSPDWLAAAFKQEPQGMRTVASAGDASEDFSETEVFKFERRLRKVANAGVSDMEKIADAMGHSFTCMDSGLCRKSVMGDLSGYE
jgi:hypothetical protein